MAPVKGWHLPRERRPRRRSHVLESNVVHCAESHDVGAGTPENADQPHVSGVSDALENRGATVTTGRERCYEVLAEHGDRLIYSGNTYIEARCHHGTHRPASSPTRLVQHIPDKRERALIHNGPERVRVIDVDRPRREVAGELCASNPAVRVFNRMLASVRTAVSLVGRILASLVSVLGEERHSVEQVVRLEHEAGPHHLRRSSEPATGGRPILIAVEVVHSPRVPHDNVSVAD